MSTGGGFRDAAKAFGESAQEGTSPFVHQTYSDTCAVQCQHLVLNQFGVSVSEDQLVREATAMGLYAPGSGTQLADVGKLLEAHGLAVHRELNANVFNLATELAQGHQVIVGLDSGQLWNENSVLESIANHFGIGQADHAVIVSGIDTTDPDHVKVIVTDPGTGHMAKEYPLPDFLDAWKTSQFAMVATAEPTPSWHPEMVNFDYDAGHIPMIGEVPYALAEQLGQAAEHESSPGVLDELALAFLALVDGEIPLDQVLHDIGTDALHHLPGAELIAEVLSLVSHDDGLAESAQFDDSPSMAFQSDAALPPEHDITHPDPNDDADDGSDTPPDHLW